MLRMRVRQKRSFFLAFTSYRLERSGPDARMLRMRFILFMMTEKYIFPFEKLEVWQLAVDLAEFILSLLEDLPPNRHIRLISQMEAAVASPGQNIAEGKGRQYKKAFIQYLYIARGSIFEVVTLNEIFKRKGLFKNNQCTEIRDLCIQIDRKINGLVKSIKQASPAH